MASGDVTIAQDGGQGNVKAHPYLVALVRWCVSCLWSTATVLLHRLLAGYTIRPSITASKAPLKSRAVSKDHLHPEPKVECQVLHAPAKHSMDVIFVHGLYGSLGNTWRQGDWRPKYKMGPNKVPLLRPSSCTCRNDKNDGDVTYKNIDKNGSCKKTRDTDGPFQNMSGIEGSYKNMGEIGNFYKNMEEVYDGIKILPKEEMFITEKFFDQTVLDQVEILDNFETQAQFVRDLFESENRFVSDGKYDGKFDGKVEVDVTEVTCECKVAEGRRCKVGCGCVCDECYSSCWPRDWIREDYPGARVISINYTSDPYLWRPVWVKECKRLRLHERAEQMIKQLIDLGVGDKPIIWVGHSKGGLFIKQIYCEAFEAHLKRTKDQTNTKRPKLEDENTSRENKAAHSNSYEDINDNNLTINNHCDITLNNNNKNDSVYDTEFQSNENNINYNDDVDGNSLEKLGEESGGNPVMSSNSEEDSSWLKKKAGLWTHSAGFMFYSVPHRGSPLAGIKTPLTARSIELLEISKDCNLVLSLQDRWLKATESSRPQVRSLVETNRTLMSVLWLRIVSVPSADAGIGALYGVSVDHREICKPSSRRCLLYEELMSLIQTSLNKCQCDS